MPTSNQGAKIIHMFKFHFNLATNN